MKKKHPLAITVATDGACSGNPGPGGWAVLIKFEDGSIEEFGGREENTTNNRMELQAALKALERLKEIPRDPNLTIKTDSKYLINGLSNWIKNWKKKGWITSSGKPVLNKDLWESLDHANLDEVKLVYVKGHSGEIDNERVDKIAVSFSKGVSIKLNSSKNRISSKKNPEEISINSSMNVPKTDTRKIQELLSKLEIIEQFAQKEYGLEIIEIAELLDMSIKELKAKKEAFHWREWIIEPLQTKLWRIRKSKD